MKKPFFACVKERYEDAAKMGKLKGQLGAFPLFLLEYGAPVFQNHMGFCQKLMDIDFQAPPLKDLYVKQWLRLCLLDIPLLKFTLKYSIAPPQSIIYIRTVVW